MFYVEHLQVLKGMFGFFEPREMLRSFAAKGIYCLKLVVNGSRTRGEKNRLRLTRTAYIIEGDVEIGFHNRFICVGLDISIYALLTGGRSLIPSCLGLCNVSTGCVYFSSCTCVPFLYVYGYLPWHGHVLPRTLIIKIMCVNQLYLQG